MYYFDPSATPTIWAIIYELLLAKLDSIKYLTKHPFTSSSNLREWSKSTIRFLVRVKGRIWSRRLLIDGIFSIPKSGFYCFCVCFSLIYPSSSSEEFSWWMEWTNAVSFESLFLRSKFLFLFSLLCWLYRLAIFYASSTGLRPFCLSYLIWSLIYS